MKKNKDLSPCISSFLGNLLEHYDTALFSLLSPFLAPMIFPKKAVTEALIYTYAFIPLGMLARPLGAYVFGLIGDRSSREKALCISLFFMGMVSLLIGLSPHLPRFYLLAPWIFSLARIAQNFFAAGEVVGAAVYILEREGKDRKDLLSGIYGATTIGGVLLASCAVTYLCSTSKLDQWHSLYVIGSSVALFGVFLRKKKTVGSLTNAHRIPVSHRQQIKELLVHKSAMIKVAICSGFSYASFSLCCVVPGGLLPLVGHVTKEQMVSANSILLILDFSLLPLMGYVAMKVGRRKVMLGASLLSALSTPLLFTMMESRSLYFIFSARVLLVFLGVAFCAPFYAWAEGLVEKKYRYSVVSIGYAIGAQLLGAPFAAIAIWLFTKTQSLTYPSLYWLGLAMLASLVLVWDKIFHNERALKGKEV